MSKITVTVSDHVQAPATTVYNILADYNHHRNILPPNYFPGLDVVEGGIGEGTQFVLHAKTLGGTVKMYMVVTEPQPGSVLMERDINTNLVTTFTVKPRSSSESHVTFETVWQPKPGLKGIVDRYTAPFFMRLIYRQELQILEQYARQQIHPDQRSFA